MKKILLLLAVAFWGAGALAQSFEQKPLQEALNPDGTIRQGAGGSFSTEGYQMQTDAKGRPIFVARNTMSAMSTPNTWSALVGAGGGNGVNDHVNAIAVSGSDVFVGGSFTQANTGGTVVAANRIARFNTSTNTWSALEGAGGGNGVSSTVWAITVSGSDVFVGGQFAQANTGGTTVAANYIARFNPQSVSATQSVSADGLFSFPPTGVSIFFTGVSGSGSCTVERYDAPAHSVSFSGAPPVNQSRYRFVITVTGFTFTNAELRFNRTQIPNAGISNAATVNVHRRPTTGTGAFDVLTNAFSTGAPDEVRATTTAFGEFILGAGADNPLPVELTEFGFRKAERGIELVWTTASEKNNAGFEVQMMNDERRMMNEWKAIGFVKGSGTTTESKSYSFVDRTASGKVSYRLKQVDFDGAFEYSPVIEVEAGLPRTFALAQNYPNPFNPSTVISYELPLSSEVKLVVYDLLGREVATLVNARQAAGRYQAQFNAASLSSGMYFYRLQAGAFVETKKMMLVK